MAVVSISRIQVRRGTALQGTGLPQLASGEFGWAIDTQELYIGNGSTSEGAPAVGNTKILTENVNVLSLARQYTYQDEILTGTAARTISERLDDRVSIRAFEVGSSITQTQQLQKALFELYLNPQGNETEYAYVLHVEPGIFDITETIYVPPFTTIIGAGKDRTIFKKNGNFAMFETIISDPGQYDGTLASASVITTPLGTNDQSREIRLEHMTLETTSNSIGTQVPLLKLNSTRNSSFKKVKFKGSKVRGQETDSDDVAIEFISESNAVRTRDNQFIECEFIDLGFAGYSSSNITDNTFERCTFEFLKKGLVLGENLAFDQDGPTDNVITLSTFDNIDEQAFFVPAGTKNSSVKNTYGRNVGNLGGNADVARYPIVEFTERGNLSIDDVFKRTRDLAINQTFITGGVDAAPYYPEVAGPVFFTWGFYEEFTVNQAGVNSPLLTFRLPADTTKFYTVEYFYKSTETGRSFNRSGELEIHVNRDNGIDEVEITDNYEVTGDENFNEAIKFTGSISSVQDSASPSNTVYATDISIENPGDEGLMTIRVTSKS